MALSAWKIHEPVPVPVPLIKPLKDMEGFWKCARSKISGIVFISVVLAGWCWPLSLELGHGAESILSPRWALFWGDFVQHLYCVGCLQRGAFNPKCTSLMFHTKVLDQCLWQLAASYWFRLKFVSRGVCRWGEVIKINAPSLFCLSSTVQFSSKEICAVFSSWPPSSNSLAQFWFCLALVIH